MSYLGNINIDAELKKAAKGRPTKLPIVVVLYQSLRSYPAIQKQIAEAFGIIED